ncbi:hypothetical protein [Sulfurimonas sp.]|uniref:hypothetical protein n=1 Tax=Sulfurimonas sp. TaxID=2022749 RepID=UPI002B45F19D|nr:hypothetical protein [Sulfurimonas sp.]
MLDCSEGSIIKDDFLPYDLIKEANSIDKTLFITTPVFIKALSKVQDTNNLNNCTFVSSTAPLSIAEVYEFENKFNTQIFQLFGSTETGGIAYKKSSTELWSALDSVILSELNNQLSISSPYISNYIIQDKIKKLPKTFNTEDIVSFKGNKFKLLGRSGRIIKIAGKRIATAQIESIIETIDGIKGVIITPIYKENTLKNEQITISLEATRSISKKEIRDLINQSFGILSIPFNIEYIEKINYSSIGKKESIKNVIP